MPDTTSTPEWEIFQTATNVDPEWDKDLREGGEVEEYERHPGRFEGAANLRIAMALDTILSGGTPDAVTGSVDEGGHFALIGRWVLRTDEQGFVTYDEFDTDQAAEVAFDDLTDEARSMELSEASANVVDALARLYELNDGDEAAVGELMFEIDKAARRKWSES